MNPLKSLFFKDNSDWLSLSRSEYEEKVVPIYMQINDNEQNDIFKKISSKQFDYDNDLNEVLPVLFASLVYAHEDHQLRKYKTIEDFIFNDQEYYYIQNPSWSLSLLFLSNILSNEKESNHLFKYYTLLYSVYFGNAIQRKSQDNFLRDLSSLTLANYWLKEGQEAQAFAVLDKITEKGEIKHKESFERLYCLLMSKVLQSENIEEIIKYSPNPNGE